jgi:CHAD domain-containing protein/CYTH domain-containing protein
MLEIERKYLLKPSVLELRIPGTYCVAITQFYTHVSPNKSVRYRSVEGSYFKTVKIGTGGIREEREKEISAKRYKKRQKKRIGLFIKKRRCFFAIDGVEYSVDIYEKPLQNLYVLEVEFVDEEAYRNFSLPDQIKTHVLKEVTDDACYKNKNLALFGAPLAEEDPARALGQVLQKLQKLFSKTLSYRQKVLACDDEEDLHQFRVSLRTAVSLLENFSLLWEDGVAEEYRVLLKEVLSITNHKRDLDVMKKRLRKVEKSIRDKSVMKAYKKLMDEVEVWIAREQRYITAYLQSIRFETIEESYENFLEKEAVTKSTCYGSYAIKSVCSYIICRRFEKIEKMHKKIDYKNEWEKLHKLRIAFKKLRYLLENCETFEGDKSMKKALSDMKKLQKSLGAFHDAHQQREIFTHLPVVKKDKKVGYFVKNILLPHIHAYQQNEIDAIKDEVEAFLKHRKVFRSLCTPAT